MEISRSHWPRQPDGGEEYDPTSVDDDKEKAIPFLRQLTEMLQYDDELISFIPGQGTTHGKIAIHDRHRVQTEVLPIFFNHASFASLRRQLSYFNFVRVGKSRQSDVAYTNDSVMELADILKLKRRTGGPAEQAAKQSRGHKRQRKPRKQMQLKKQKEEEKTQPTTCTINSDGGRSSTPSSISRSISRGESSSTSYDASNKDSSQYTGKPSGTISIRSMSPTESARVRRLLTINNIVPFIHLPEGCTARQQEGEISAEGSAGIGRESVAKDNQPEDGRETAMCDGAIHALLTLGSCHS